MTADQKVSEAPCRPGVMVHRVHVFKAHRVWNWQCLQEAGGAVLDLCDFGSRTTQPNALNAGLLHIAYFHPKDHHR